MKKLKCLCRLQLFVLIFIGVITGLAAQNNKPPLRESIEWLDVWMPNTNDSALPRILLIGNSITRGYYTEVQKALTGKAYIARLTTSKSIGDPALLQEIELVMSYYKFDIVHFNNGLHGWAYTEKEFGNAFPSFIKLIREMAPSARLVWATITPMRTKADINAFDVKTERIKERNKIALDFISKQNDIKVVDLWTLTVSKPEFYHGGDGTHPNAAGYQAIGQKVASELSDLLKERK